LWIIASPYASLFLADESPHFVNFQTIAGKIAHLGVQQGRTSTPDTDPKPHDRVAVNSGHALNSTDAGAFRKRSYYCDLHILRQYIRHISPAGIIVLQIYGEGQVFL
jgi:hypothetical protein